MIRVCCSHYHEGNRIMGTKPPFWMMVITHGFCEFCQEKEIKEVEEAMSEYRYGNGRCLKCGERIYHEDGQENCDCPEKEEKVGECESCAKQFPLQDMKNYFGFMVCPECFSELPQRKEEEK